MIHKSILKQETFRDKQDVIHPIAENLVDDTESGKQSGSNSKDHLRLISTSQLAKENPSLVLNTNVERGCNIQKMIIEEEILIPQQYYVIPKVIH